MKIYSSLTDAFDRAQAVYGDYDTWFTNYNCDAGDVDDCSELFAKRIIEFMKISKDCGQDEGCISSAPLLRVNGTQERENYLKHVQAYSGSHMVMLPDGMSLAFNNCYANGSGIDCRIRVDIDGPNKGKNQEGNDLFYFYIYDRWLDTTDNQLKPEGTMAIMSSEVSNLNFTAWVIDHGNLDYLKCMDELDWETQTSCK